jgi:hypothetical protein
MAETMQIIRDKLIEYMSKKKYLDENDKISAANNAYSWNAMEVNVDSSLIKHIQLPRGYLLGGIEVPFFNAEPKYGSGDFFEIASSLNFHLSVIRALAEKEGLDFEIEKTCGTIRGAGMQAPYIFVASFKTPQKDALVKTKTVDSLVKAVRFSDKILCDPKFEEQMKTYLKRLDRFRKRQVKAVLGR